jgi:hypothetical protein
MKQLDARACTLTYVIICGIFGFFFALGILIGIRPGGEPKFTLLTAVAFIVSVLWVRTFHLVVADGVISYRSLFGGTRSVSATNIEKAVTELNLRSGFRPPMQPVIYPTNANEERPIRINRNAFSREDLARVFDFLGPKLKSSRRISLVSDDTV